MSDHPILEAIGLGRSFGNAVVLSSLDLRIGRSERVALRGSNGAGKTTLLRCIAGTLRPTAGRVDVGGHLAGTIPARRLVGVSFSHERSFYLRLTGRDNLLLFARLRGLSAAGAAIAVAELEAELEIGDIAAHRVDRCSTGMVQQLGFARSLLGEPRLVLLDEPTRSLDDAAVGRLWAALDRRSEAALLIATHDERDVRRCSREIRLGE